MDKFIDKMLARLRHTSVRQFVIVFTLATVVSALFFAEAIFLLFFALTKVFGIYEGETTFIWIIEPLTAIVCSTLLVIPLSNFFGRVFYRVVNSEREAQLAMERAEEASKSRAKFIANASHEIRTPLNGIHGIAELLASSELPAPYDEQVEMILENSDALLMVLNDILDISKIDEGRLSLEPQNISLNRLVNRLFRFWQSIAQTKSIELELNISADIPETVEIDGGRLRQCMSNLISNAIKFSEKGKITLSLSRHPDSSLFVFDVIDSGPGVPEELRDIIFEPFQQNLKLKKSEKGTGLGLSISKELSKMLGGDLALVNDVATGAHFRLTFNAPTIETQSETIDHDELSARLEPMLFLIVDDNATNRYVARAIVENFGHKAVEASNGQDALNRLQSERYDIVLLDNQMPDMSGEELFKTIRENTAWDSIKVIAMTAQALNGSRDYFLNDVGMNGYISKPVSIESICNEVLRVCEIDDTKLDEDAMVAKI